MAAPAFPSGILRWTGNWSATTLYHYGDVVLSSTNISYACGITTSLNQDPAPPPSPAWAAFPSSGGGGGNPDQWSLYPALQTIGANGFSINQVESIGANQLSIQYTPNYPYLLVVGSTLLGGDTLMHGTVEMKDLIVQSGIINMKDTTTDHLLTSLAGNLFFDGSQIATVTSIPNVNGTLNKLGVFPALPYTGSSSSTPAVNQVATAIVPDGTFPVNVPTVGAVQGGWGFSKPALSAAYFNYYPYNPRFGLSPPFAALPYQKSFVQSAWVLIRPTVNLYLPGYFAINLYTYDDANVPTSGFFNTRWAYSNSTGAVAGATGTNLYAGYTYLLYAYDAPRITNTAAIGVPDSQVSGLRDPYDIYTDVNHIALQNCVVAFNPWTDGTNFRTWANPAVPGPPFVSGNTVVFAGQGTNYNGLFFIAGPGTPAAAIPPMVNGVVSANWTLISPQPSSFADQNVSQISITQGTPSAQAVGYVVLDIGFSYGPTTTSTTVSEHISLLPN